MILDDIPTIGNLISAASSAGDREVSLAYLAEARVLFMRARRDLDEIEILLVARERDLVRASA